MFEYFSRFINNTIFPKSELRTQGDIGGGDDYYKNGTKPTPDEIREDLRW